MSGRLDLVTGHVVLDALKAVDGISPTSGGSGGRNDVLLLQHDGKTLAHAIARPLNGSRPQWVRLRRLAIHSSKLPKAAIGDLKIDGAEGAVIVDEANVAQGVKLVKYLVEQHDLGKRATGIKPPKATPKPAAARKAATDRTASQAAAQSVPKRLEAVKKRSDGVVRREIIKALGQLGFEPDELAYLALTSKPELPVRDRLAWALTKAGHRVAREALGNRVDLAVLDADDDPVVTLELKAAHTARVEWGLAGSGGKRGTFAALHDARTYFEGLIRADAAKALACAGPEGEAYVAVVLYHVADAVQPRLDAFVKYGVELRRVADPREAERKIGEYLARLGEATQVPLGAGTAFGVRCTVDVWLCGPLQGPRVS